MSTSLRVGRGFLRSLVCQLLGESASVPISESRDVAVDHDASPLRDPLAEAEADEVLARLSLTWKESDFSHPQNAMSKLSLSWEDAKPEACQASD